MKHDFIAKSASKPPKPQLFRKRRGDILGVIVIAVFIMIGCAIAQKTYRPLKLNICEKAALKRLEQEYIAALNENERLKREIRFYQTKSGALAGARELGYVRPGETPISIEEPKR